MQVKHLLIVLLFVILMTAGCAGHRHRQRSPHGTKLSEAMQKSSDEYKGDRTITTDTSEPDREHFRPPIIRLSEPDESALKKASDEEKQYNFINVAGLNVGTGILEGNDFHRLNHADISFGFCTKEKNRLDRFEGFIGLGRLLVDETAVLHNSIDDAWLWSIGLRYKRFTTPDHTFLGHYFTLGLSYDYLHWSYENDILVDDRIVGSDGLFGFELFGGMGFNLAQFTNYQLGVELVPTMVVWDAYTDEGFDNDVFGTLLILKLRFTMSYLSRSKQK